jgi:phage N-6-adenine-methyltransferase
MAVPDHQQHAATLENGISSLSCLSSGPVPIGGGRLSALECIIERGLRSFIEVGAALAEISESRLYREQGYRTFEEYCAKRWGLSRRTAYQRIDAARVAKNVNSSSQTAPSFTQARELASLTSEQQRAAAESLNFAEATVEDVRAAARAVKGQNNVHFRSESQEWYTPPEIVRIIETFFGEIDLDPCSEGGLNPTIPARARYTQSDDGLSHQWFGRVYMNPPYGSEIGNWVEKLVSEYETGGVTEAIALVPARTDTRWFGRFAGRAMVCFVRGRLKFSGNEKQAPFPSALVYLGLRPDAFCDSFATQGHIWIGAQEHRLTGQ